MASPESTSYLSLEEHKIKTIEAAVSQILSAIGEDATREGLLQTPSRVARSLKFLTSGHDQELGSVTGEAIFQENHKDIVIVKDIQIYSMCEHHMLPFFGKVHIGYIPDGQVIGLSKLARIAEMYARRLQVQERLNQQIADAVMKSVSPKGVGVIIEAEHMCMSMRGANKNTASTTTSVLRGNFNDDKNVRKEFWNLMRPISL